MGDADVAVELMVQWLRAGLTGCEFARVFAKGPAPADVRSVAIRGALETPSLADELQAILLRASQDSAAVLLVFPNLRYDEEVAELANLLSQHSAWNLWEPRWPRDAQRDDVLVALD